MASNVPLPKPNFRWSQPDGTPTQAFYLYMQQRSANIIGPLIAVAAPGNANAATAGVPLNGLYTDTADPAKVYVRTV
jgi:hypothetical protein